MICVYFNVKVVVNNVFLNYFVYVDFIILCNICINVLYILNWKVWNIMRGLFYIKLSCRLYVDFDYIM